MRSRLVRLLRVGIAAALAAAVAVGAPASAGAGGKREVTVMTQNLYLGSSLAPALTATSVPAFLAGVAQIYGTVLRTDFPTRAVLIADEVAEKRPDLIGLQEVTNWIAVPTHAGPTPISFDFLALLQDQLASRGLHYTVAAVSDNANIGPVPLIAPPLGCSANVPAPPAVPDCVVTLRDRDVILVNADTPSLTWSNPMHGRFTAQQTVRVPTGNVLSFDRGWASIDATFDRSPFRFVTSHLEVADFPTVQEAQARELTAGPLHTLRPVILAGDFNSAADGSTTASYRILLHALFADAWWTNFGKPGFSCCQDEALDNPTSNLTSRIDLVLTRLALPTSARLIGDRTTRTAPPLWPSDHAGLVATARLP
jgi:endonuclease/exonuclease/phosphatase family metal-dependent hydrolase